MEQSDRKERVLPVIEEELVADTRPVKTGAVRVEKHVERRVRRVDLPVLKETVEVKRVPVNRIVDSPPAVRRSGDTIIVPVTEERVIVTRRLVVTEEIHLIRRRTRERITKQIPVERERAVIRRLDAQGRVVDSTRPPRPLK